MSFDPHEKLDNVIDIIYNELPCSTTDYFHKLECTKNITRILIEEILDCLNDLSLPMVEDNHKIENMIKFWENINNRL